MQIPSTSASFFVQHQFKPPLESYEAAIFSNQLRRHVVGMARAASISTPKDNLRQDNKRISGSNRAFLPFPHEISGNLSLEVKFCGFFCLLHLSCKAQLAGGGLLRSQNQKKQQLLCAKSL